MPLCCQRNSASTLDVNSPVGPRGRLRQNADEVDEGIRSRDRIADSDVVKHVGLDHLRYPCRFSRNLNTAGMAHGHAYARAT